MHIGALNVHESIIVNGHVFRHARRREQYGTGNGVFLKDQRTALRKCTSVFRNVQRAVSWIDSPNVP